MERQAAQEALTVSEARYRGLFDHMQNVFAYRKVMVDNSGRPADFEFVSVNPMYEATAGIPTAAIVGKRWTELIHGIQEDFTDWIKILGEVALSGKPVTYEGYSKLTGKYYRLTAYSPEQGYVASITEDITERKQYEEQMKYYSGQLAATNNELEQKNQKLEEINAEMKSFINSVAHDFRSPMVNLKGFTKELGYSLSELQQIIQEEKLHLPEKVEKKVNDLLYKDVPDAQKFISSAVGRLSRMVDVMLKLARLGRREMVRKEVDINEVAGTILQTFNHQIEERNIRVEIGYLPKITTDQLAIEQVLGNLFDNAIKYLKQDRPGKIKISCLDQGQEYLICIEDNGRGIAAADINKIFEIFRRAGTQDIPGEGMGLAYVRTLVRQLDGRVWCESELGVGTTFNFTLPKPGMICQQ